MGGQPAGEGFRAAHARARSAVTVSIALISALISVVRAALLLRGRRVHRRVLPRCVGGGCAHRRRLPASAPHAVEDASAFSPQIGSVILGGLLGFF
ncbi:MAG: hypothetical protein H6806_00445 [Planctomycetes bacterium]|nr:hypothetical protein [Planctomycetota bacterium]